jgi:AraC-like DNA-binding protein
MSHSAGSHLLIQESFITPRRDDGTSAQVPQLRPSFDHRYGAYRPPIRFLARDPSDRCDAYRVSPGMIMLIVNVSCADAFRSRLSGQDIVEFHYRLSGSISISGSWGQVEQTAPSCLIWYQPFGCDDAAEQIGARSNERETWISLYCDRTWLCRSMGEYAARLLDSLVGGGQCDSSAPRFRLQTQQGIIRRILNDLIQTRGDSAIDWSYGAAKATELLCVTLKHTVERKGNGIEMLRMSGSDQRLLQEARDLLKEQLIEPPRLGALARRVGMNPTKLCALFRQQYEESMFTFVRRQRLEHAHDLLAYSGLQIRQVAAAVGYRHHSSFTAAFTKHFGFVPKAAQQRSFAAGSATVPDGAHR